MPQARDSVTAVSCSHLAGHRANVIGLSSARSHGARPALLSIRAPSHAQDHAFPVVVPGQHVLAAWRGPSTSRPTACPGRATSSAAIVFGGTDQIAGPVTLFEFIGGPRGQAGARPATAARSSARWRRRSSGGAFGGAVAIGRFPFVRTLVDKQKRGTGKSYPRRRVLNLSRPSVYRLRCYGTPSPGPTVGIGGALHLVGARVVPLTIRVNGRVLDSRGRTVLSHLGRMRNKEEEVGSIRDGVVSR